MTLLKNINETIDYAHQFGGELTLKQLHHRLLSKTKYSLEEIKKSITNYELRITNNKESTKKIKLASELMERHLSKFKDILMVAVTGSVAAENAKKQEDIDIFIICKRDTLWLTRLKLRLYIKLNNIPHRRYGKREKPNDFCFNLWMDENSLTVPKLKQNQKNAVDIVMMKVMLNRDNTYQKFINKNKWIKKYVANGYSQLRITNYELRINRNKTGIIIVCLNYLAYIGQLLYIRLKGPVRFINLRQAFFHK